MVLGEVSSRRRRVRTWRSPPTWPVPRRSRRPWKPRCSTSQAKLIIARHHRIPLLLVHSDSPALIEASGTSRGGPPAPSRHLLSLLGESGPSGHFFFPEGEGEPDGTGRSKLAPSPRAYLAKCPHLGLPP